MFKKILIANRGEIACRIARSARSAGIRSVAVYSDADRNALHVSSCDEAVHIGGSAANESYLLGDKIIQAALNTGAEAIHPGFGFLSENAEFAEACAQNELVFIGPGTEAIRSMGSKSAARHIMQAAGVPVVPGYDGDNQEDDFLLTQARETGFPLLIKAVAGGGGKGLRVVEAEEDFTDALHAVRRESMAAFADDNVLLELYLPTARHIEIQVFADSHGNVVHLFERDCSLQRRHQKVIEEAPAPGINDILRADMAKAAIQCAKAVDYLGAGTVEFLLAPDETFYFMEMNTRLQVEHPVTEMITGQDLVSWQFGVAAGEALPVNQRSLSISGHAIEARIYAENPEANFLPSIGRLDHLHPPLSSDTVRIDTGVLQGDEISPYYDPMIAKLICHGSNRQQALQRLEAALGEFQLIGPSCNINFLETLCTHPAVRAGGVDTRFIDSRLEELTGIDTELDQHALVVAAVFTATSDQQRIHERQQQTGDPWSPWAETGSWRIGAMQTQTLHLEHAQQDLEIEISRHGDAWKVGHQDRHYWVETVATPGRQLDLLVNGASCRAVAVAAGEKLSVLLNNRSWAFTHREVGFTAGAMEHHKDSLFSPMPGKIIACNVEAGQQVSQGETLMVIEAMKMEHSIQAPHDGEIAEVFFGVDDQVNDGQVLLAYKD